MPEVVVFYADGAYSWHPSPGISVLSGDNGCFQLYTGRAQLSVTQLPLVARKRVVFSTTEMVDSSYMLSLPFGEDL